MGQHLSTNHGNLAQGAKKLEEPGHHDEMEAEGPGQPSTTTTCYANP